MHGCVDECAWVCDIIVYACMDTVFLPPADRLSWWSLHRCFQLQQPRSFVIAALYPSWWIRRNLSFPVLWRCSADTAHMQTETYKSWCMSPDNVQNILPVTTVDLRCVYNSCMHVFVSKIPIYILRRRIRYLAFFLRESCSILPLRVASRVVVQLTYTS